MNFLSFWIRLTDLLAARSNHIQTAALGRCVRVLMQDDLRHLRLQGQGQKWLPPVEFSILPAFFTEPSGGRWIRLLGVFWFGLPTAHQRNMWRDSGSISAALHHCSSTVAPSNPLFSCCSLRLFCSATSFRVSFDSLIHPSLFNPSFSTHLPSIHFSPGGEFVPNAFCFALFALCAGTIISHCRS